MCWWFTVCRTPVFTPCLGWLWRAEWSFCGERTVRGVGGHVWEKREAGCISVSSSQRRSSRCSFNGLLSNPSSGCSRLFTMSCTLFFRLCQEWDHYCQTLWVKAIDMQRGRVRTWKGYLVETSVPAHGGNPARLHENASVFMWAHLQGGSSLPVQWACRWLFLPHKAVGIRGSQQATLLGGRPG